MPVKLCNSSGVVEMEEGLKCFLWHESTTQPEGKILLDKCKTGDVVRDGMLGGKEPTLI